MTLDYPSVLEYLSDREGDPVTVNAYPSFGTRQGPTLLGLTLAVELGKVEAVEPHEEQWLDGRAGVRIRLLGGAGHDDGLVLTREWFGGAFLDESRSHLRIIVRANAEAPPLYPPVGSEDDDDGREVYPHDFVGWGFAFDFDGSAPDRGRWSSEASGD
jgi:hypothetical protein